MPSLSWIAMVENVLLLPKWRREWRLVARLDEQIASMSRPCSTAASSERGHSRKRAATPAASDLFTDAAVDKGQSNPCR
eukprot:9046899-Pyramimonas_sp.AAC.1